MLLSILIVSDLDKVATTTAVIPLDNTTPPLEYQIVFNKLSLELSLPELIASSEIKNLGEKHIFLYYYFMN